MWVNIARFVLKFRLLLLVILAAATGFMGYHASKVQMSYEFARTIPTDNPKFVAYQEFRKKFGEDGNLLVVGLQSDKIFNKDVFDDYIKLHRTLKSIAGVEEVLGVGTSVNLIKKDSSEKLITVPLFREGYLSQAAIDSGKRAFFNLLFYRGILYNPATSSYLIAINVNKDIMNSAKRTTVVRNITDQANAFGEKHGLTIHLSGLPLIRTNMATKIAAEMKWFLISSIILSAFILLIFFRSFSTTALSLAVVIIGVVFSLGTMDILGYKITLLSVVIPPLIVVIGIPNCIYFLNKYHTAFKDTKNRQLALAEMIRRMGIVTLFCNITAAIGFGVFALTRSAVLKEFGVVAGINIMLLFLISFILIPGVLSYLPDPKQRHMKYLTNKWLSTLLTKIEYWAINRRKVIYITTAITLAFSIAGIFRIRSEGFIVDDLPKTDKIYTDLKFFETNFRGVMPLEIVVNTKKRKGLSGLKALPIFQKIDTLSTYIASQPQMSKPLSVVEGLKFVRQAFYEGDSALYALPTDFELVTMSSYLNSKADSSAKKSNLSRLVASFVDSAQQETRISVNMADVGTKRLPVLLDSIQHHVNLLFDSSKYSVELTGSSVTFLTGSDFIIKGLKQSIGWAFLLIAACMLYLFRSVRILFCSLIPNMIPLIITAGVMGWLNVALKPSTVLVFSIALGIAIDITIRFLVNYKQELANSNQGEEQTVINTIYSTGISIIYTSLVLIAGFAIFCFSDFGGTKALGWLTSLTLVMATITNLVFLPAFLITLAPKQKDTSKDKSPAVNPT